MKYSVSLTQDARQDIAEIAAHIAGQDGLAKAGALLDGIVAVVEALETMPQRGRQVPELRELGWSHIRERFFKPHRIIYRIDGAMVRILLVLDGRRELQTLLLRRLTGPLRG